jgi:hypothetical protein
MSMKLREKTFFMQGFQCFQIVQNFRAHIFRENAKVFEPENNDTVLLCTSSGRIKCF